MSIYALETLFMSKAAQDVTPDLVRLKPSRQTLLALWERFTKFHVAPDILEALLAYCKDRGYDPVAPPLANRIRHKPVGGETRRYSVQWVKRTGRPYLLVPLDTFGEPDEVLAHFRADGRSIEIVVYDEAV